MPRSSSTPESSPAGERLARESSPARERLARTLPLWGGVLAVAAVTGAALLLDGLLRDPAPHPTAHLDRLERTCRAEATDRRFPVRAVLFDGVFAGRDAWADSVADRWVDVFTGDFAPTMRTFLSRAESMRGLVEPVLEDHGIPVDFLYLAVIESGMNPRAVSRARAVGPWQFMHFTAREMGLSLSWAVDERRDPVAATEAAARYLRSLHDEFGDWALAAAAYNAGPWRVRSAMRIYGEDTFWALARRGALPRETTHYVPKLIAAAHVAHDPGGTGLDYVPPRPAPDWRVVAVEPGSRLDVIAAAAGTSLERIEDLNPHLIRGISSPRSPSLVRLPREGYGRFHTAYHRIPAEERRGQILHEVRSQETLAGIAREYGVEVDRLVAANGVDPRRLRVGQTIQVPTTLF